MRHQHGTHEAAAYRLCVASARPARPACQEFVHCAARIQYSRNATVNPDSPTAPQPHSPTALCPSPLTPGCVLCLVFLHETLETGLAVGSGSRSIGNVRPHEGLPAAPLCGAVSGPQFVGVCVSEQDWRENLNMRECAQ